MSGIDTTRWCDNCGVEIYWGPLVVGKFIYCCQDCYRGLRCKCAERMELDDDRRDQQSAVEAMSNSN